MTRRITISLPDDVAAYAERAGNNTSAFIAEVLRRRMRADSLRARLAGLGHEVWIPALCLGEATSQLIGTKQRVVLDVLTGSDSDVKIAVYDGATSRRVARIAAEQGIGIDAAHAIATALLYRCYLVTSSPDLAAAAGRLGVETLDLSQT